MATREFEKKYPYTEHVDHMEDGLKTNVQYDRFGSAAKVDPKEIALVKKIDRHMMVCALYYELEMSVDRQIANSLVDVFPQLS